MFESYKIVTHCLTVHAACMLLANVLMDKSSSSLCSGYSVWRGKLGLELSRARLAAAQRDLARGDTRVTRWGDSRAGNQPSRSFHNLRESP